MICLVREGVEEWVGEGVEEWVGGGVGRDPATICLVKY